MSAFQILALVRLLQLTGRVMVEWEGQEMGYFTYTIQKVVLFDESLPAVL